LWNLDTTLEKTSDWYRTYLESQKALSHQQLEEYVDAAIDAKVSWVSA
jgi:CDP-glucose 4,6-dehydratase